MRSFASVSFLICLAACTANNVIADSRSQSEQVQDREQPFCSSTCARIIQCIPEQQCVCQEDVCTCVGAEDQDLCESDCLEAIDDYRSKGESCSQMAMDLMDCFDTLACDEIRGHHRCEDIVEAHDECVDDPIDVSDPGLSGSGGASPGIGNTGGSTATGGGPGVVCMAATSSGSAGSAGTSGGLSITCDSSVEQCADGHSYRIFCLGGSNEQSSCTCVFDGLAQNSFDYAQTCPTVAEVNASCGWTLSQFGLPSF